MPGIAAVGVDDDLAAGQPAVPLRPADDKAPGRVDEVAGVFVDQPGGQHRLDDLLNDLPAQQIEVGLGAVLGGDDHCRDVDRHPVLVGDGDLALAVRPQMAHAAVPAHLGQPPGELVGERDGQRHLLGGFVAGVAEHHALVAGAGLGGGIGGALLDLDRIVDTECDVGRLLIDGGEHRAGLGVKTEFRAGVADLPDNLAGDMGDIDIAAGGDLPHQHDHAGGAAGLAGDTGIGVFGEDGVEDGVGDLVADLVGMSLSHRFAGKIGSCHNTSSFLWVSASTDRPAAGTKNRPGEIPDDA